MKPIAPQDLAAVVIGTSAGGVEALGTLLPALDQRCRAAVLIVVHLPRERPSLLKDLYASRCRLPVREVVDKEPVESGAVYFAPPDYHLLVDCQHGHPPSLALSVDQPVHYSRPSIDVLFESAAECWGAGLMGVVLTGANDDGARGLAAVARAGGITVVQEPREAAARAMPEAAIRTGCAQHVLPLAAIGALLGQLGYAP
jgi:two-component system chemotaxis response regulator CheB